MGGGDGCIQKQMEKNPTKQGMNDDVLHEYGLKAAEFICDVNDNACKNVGKLVFLIKQVMHQQALMSEEQHPRPKRLTVFK